MPSHTLKESLRRKREAEEIARQKKKQKSITKSK